MQKTETKKKRNKKVAYSYFKELWKLAQEMEEKGMHEYAKKLREIHDGLKFRKHVDYMGSKVFEGVSWDTLTLIQQITGSRQSYDPRTIAVGAAIVLARNGGRMPLDELAEQLEVYPSTLKGRIKSYKEIFWQEGDDVVMKENIAFIVKQLLDREAQQQQQ